MRAGIFLLSIVLMFACKSKKDQYPKEVLDSRIFSVETTACFGRCPIYYMYISTDGSAVLDAKRFTEADGKYKAMLEDSIVNDFFERLDQMEWSKYKAEYLTGYTDLPSVIFNYVDAVGNKTTVRFEESAAPKELLQLARSMEWWRLNVAWEAVDH